MYAILNMLLYVYIYIIIAMNMTCANELTKRMHKMR